MSPALLGALEAELDRLRRFTGVGAVGVLRQTGCEAEAARLQFTAVGAGLGGSPIGQEFEDSLAEDVVAIAGNHVARPTDIHVTRRRRQFDELAFGGIFPHARVPTACRARAVIGNAVFGRAAHQSSSTHGCAICLQNWPRRQTARGMVPVPAITPILAQPQISCAGRFQRRERLRCGMLGGNGGGGFFRAKAKPSADTGRS